VQDFQDKTHESMHLILLQPNQTVESQSLSYLLLLILFILHIL